MKKPPVKIFRCAIYTRKSTEDGLEQEFNSLDAQRESGEAYIKCQAQEGWFCVLERYDDGGFSGGNMDRPGLQRLLADIAEGKIDCVLVYKVDRLSRSLLDFAKLVEIFDRHHVSFVSVTQLINTASSMGRLMLNVLLSFAQFEREIISERTKDKIAATRRKGKWSGGMPLLGYDVTPTGSKLIVNEAEAERVRTIFDIYLRLQSLTETIAELDRRGWVNKRWTTRKGPEKGGRPFDKASLHKLLTNVTYLGKLRYKDEIHPGEHAAIVDEDIWRQVQALLGRNGRSGGADVRNRYGALLKGILRCAACDCAMSPSHSTKDGKTRYRYYVCGTANKRGWQKCPSKSIPAAEIEKLIVEQVRGICRDPKLVAATVHEARRQADTELGAVRAELDGLERDVGHWSGELQKLLPALSPAEESPATARLADLQERIRASELRAAEIRARRSALQRGLIDPDDVARALAEFDSLWAALTPQERVRIIHLLVARVDYDGATGKVSITLHTNGLDVFARAAADRNSEDAA